MCRTSGDAAKISNVAFYFHLYLNHSDSSYYDLLGRLSSSTDAPLTSTIYTIGKAILYTPPPPA